MRIDWRKDGCSWRADIGNITLCATPDHIKFGKARRGTKWRANVSIFDGKFTVSRYGRDCYDQLCINAQEARRLAEQVYSEALAKENPAG